MIHGDSLSVLRQMQDESVDAIITDPPYGIDYQSKARNIRMAKIQNDKAPFIWWLYDAFRILKPEGSLICFTRWDVQQTFIDAMHIAGFTVKSEVIWYKMAHGAGDCKAQFAPAHENILFATKGKFQFPGKRPTDVVQHMKVNSSKLVHPNEKPVALLEDLITSVTKPGDLICDPFAGSGPTAVAAEKTGRQYIVIEIEATHCDTINNRLVEVRKEEAHIGKSISRSVSSEPQASDAPEEARCVGNRSRSGNG